MPRRRSAPTYLTEKDGRIYYHYRLRVVHKGVTVVRWVTCLSEYPYDWRKSLERVRIDRERRRRAIIREIEHELAGAALNTIRWWVPRYIALIASRKKRTDADRRYLGRAVELWGDRLLDTIARADIEDGMRIEADRARETLRRRGTPLGPESGNATANRWLAAVSACLEEARRQGLIRTNPCRDVRPYREAPPRARVLSSDEQERLVAAVLDEPDEIVRAAFILLLETGARKSEVLGMRWDDLDLEAATWRIPSPKAGRPQIVPLTEPLVQLLRELPRTSEWVITGPRGRRHDLRGEWRRLKERAGIPRDVTIHDLRRTFGLRIARTAGLHIASRLLRHSSIRITEQVYAPLGLDDLRQAAAAASTLPAANPAAKRIPHSAQNPAPSDQTPSDNPKRDQ